MFEELYETKPAARAEVATTKPTDVALEDIDLQKLALSHFDASDAALAIARQKLVGVVHDLSTATKLAEAKSLRQRLINDPLAEARKVNKGLKAKLTAVSKAVGSRLESIEAGFADVETLITPQIEARDAEFSAEKAAREEKEAARVAVHRANIQKLAGYVAQLQGKTSAQILAAINAIDAVEIIPEQWEEFAAGAEIQKAETLDALQSLYNVTKNAEAEAEAREAKRIENERAAAALAEERRQIEAERAELKRQADELAAAKKAEADRIEAAAQAQRDAEAKAQADAEAAARQAAEDEANRLAQEAAAESLQRITDATPADVIADAYAPEQLNDDAPAAMPQIADEVPPVEPPAAREPDEPSAHHMAAVSPGILHPTPGPVVFAEPEPEPAAPTQFAALLAHIDESFTGRFSAHPKPSREWWGTLSRLSDEARGAVAA